MAKTRLDELWEEMTPTTRRRLRRQVEIASLTGNHLREMGLTQEQFAEQIGMRPSQLSRILSGSENLTLGTIARLEEALGVDLITTPLSIQPLEVVVVQAPSESTLDELTASSAITWEDFLVIDEDKAEESTRLTRPTFIPTYAEKSIRL